MYQWALETLFFSIEMLADYMHVISMQIWTNTFVIFEMQNIIGYLIDILGLSSDQVYLWLYVY